MNKIYECIVGSQAYGTALPESDTDIKGIEIVLNHNDSKFDCDRILYNIQRDIQNIDNKEVIPKHEQEL